MEKQQPEEDVNVDIEKSIKDARSFGFIVAHHLPFILASWEENKNILPILWRESGLAERKNNLMPSREGVWAPGKDLQISTQEDALAAWYFLIMRWTHAGGRLFNKLGSIQTLCLYKEGDSGWEKLADINKKADTYLNPGMEHYIKLTDFEDYLEIMKKREPFEIGKLPPELFSSATTSSQNTANDKFIRNTNISYINNSEIKIKVKDKRVRKYGYRDLGFQRDDTKEWFALLEIAQSGFINAGPSKRKTDTGSYENNPSYSKSVAILKSISKKLIPVLNRDFSAQLNNNFFLFESYPKRTGRYQLKSNSTIEEPVNFKAMTNENLLSYIKEKAALFVKDELDSNTAMRSFTLFMDEAKRRDLSEDAEHILKDQLIINSEYNDPYKTMDLVDLSNSQGKSLRHFCEERDD